MKYLSLLTVLLQLALLGSIAWEDGARYRIDPRGTCLLAAASFPRVVIRPLLWAESLLMALLICSILLLLLAMIAARQGGFLMGGGDIKLLFALLLNLEAARYPLYFGISGLYILFLRFTWPEAKKLPLGPALCGAAACLLLMGSFAAFRMALQ